MRTSIAASGKTADRRTATLRQMTVDQLLGLGTHRVAYLRAGTYHDEKLFVLYGADRVPWRQSMTSRPQWRSPASAVSNSSQCTEQRCRH